MKHAKKCIRKILTFWRLPFLYKTFFFVNFLLCGIARAAVITLSLPTLSPYFGKLTKTTIASQVITLEQRRRASTIGSSIRLAAKYTPWDSNCLTQAMVAKFWCNLFKIPYIFYIGFTKSANAASGYKGHAWVTAGPIAITGGHGFSNYHVVSSYFSSYSS